jgi:hypothetical protein
VCFEQADGEKMLTRVKTIAIATCASLAFLFQFIAPVAYGQVGPSVTTAANLSAFGDFSWGHSDWGPQAIYGYTLGGFLQSSHFIGVEIRGSALSFGGPDHQYSALGGPRVAIRLKRFTPYLVGLGGVGHARWQGEINGQLDPNANESGIGAEWSVVGGVDFYMRHHISLRLGEVSYSKIYVLQHGLTPLTYSAGITYRLPFKH